ncbi:MAG: hypothetical protein ABIE43_03350 [Patescibacteria group bacterium]
MTNLLTLKYWFNLKPESLLSIYHNLFIYFVALLILLSFIFWFMKSRRKGQYNSFWRLLYTFSLINAFIGLGLLFFNYESIPFLSARFWLILWGMGILLWLAFIYKKLMNVLEAKEKLAEEKEYRKYIP